jgi:hypothetical protein
MLHVPVSDSGESVFTLRVESPEAAPPFMISQESSESGCLEDSNIHDLPANAAIPRTALDLRERQAILW